MLFSFTATLGPYSPPITFLGALSATHAVPATLTHCSLILPGSSHSRALHRPPAEHKPLLLQGDLCWTILSLLHTWNHLLSFLALLLLQVTHKIPTCLVYDWSLPPEVGFAGAGIFVYFIPCLFSAPRRVAGKKSVFGKYLVNICWMNAITKIQTSNFFPAATSEGSSPLGDHKGEAQPKSLFSPRKHMFSALLAWASGLPLGKDATGSLLEAQVFICKIRMSFSYSLRSFSITNIHENNVHDNDWDEIRGPFMSPGTCRDDGRCSQYHFGSEATQFWLMFLWCLLRASCGCHGTSMWISCAWGLLQIQGMWPRCFPDSTPEGRGICSHHAVLSQVEVWLDFRTMASPRPGAENTLENVEPQSRAPPSLSISTLLWFPPPWRTTHPQKQWMSPVCSPPSGCFLLFMAVS